MHRWLALLLVPALIATPGAVSLLHTHVYDDHEHPEHHHGLAAHEHHRVVAQRDDDTPHVEGCDPGEHAVSLTFVCAVPPQVQALDTDIDVPGSLTPQLEITFAPQYTDVRVHGPPARAVASPRGPPAILHA